MRAALRSRLERLEIGVEPKKPQLFRSGYFKTLPADYVGERHVVIVNREPAVPPGNFEWCEFEERPGPAPVDAQEEDCTTIYIVHIIVHEPRFHANTPQRRRAQLVHCVLRAGLENAVTSPHVVQKEVAERMNNLVPQGIRHGKHPTVHDRSSGKRCRLDMAEVAAHTFEASDRLAHPVLQRE